MALISLSTEGAEEAWFLDYLPFGAAIVVAALGLFVARRRLLLAGDGKRLDRAGQLTMLILSAVFLIVVVLTLPEESSRKEILGFLGVALSAVVAFSSTTLLGNMMAGFMLRSVRSFEIGDFIRVEGHFGCVTELGLFHAEMQTEDRDLLTFPNLWLTTHPVTVVRKSGTVLGATVSIGFDEPHARIRDLLVSAAEKAGLEEPFAQILELGDHSVTYRAAGVLRSVKHIVSTRSKLRAHVLDALHGAGIEIVSPEFRIVRLAKEEAAVRAPVIRSREKESQESLESVLFDKAEEAVSIENLRKRHGELLEERKAVQAELKAKKDGEREELEKRAKRLEELVERLGVLIREREARSADAD